MGMFALAQVSTPPLVLVIRSWQDPMLVLILNNEEFVHLVDTEEEGKLLDLL